MAQLQADPIDGPVPTGLPGQPRQGMPAAQFLQLQQRGGIGGGGCQAPLPGSRSAHQALGQGGLRAGKQRGRRCLLHQSALVEDGDLIAPAPGHRQVMADQ